MKYPNDEIPEYPTFAEEVEQEKIKLAEEAYEEWYKKNITQKLKNVLGVGHFQRRDNYGKSSD